MIKVKRMGNKVLAVLVVFGLILFPLISGAAASQPLQASGPPIASMQSVTPGMSSALSSKALHLSRFNDLEKNYSFDRSHMAVHGMVINGKDINAVTIPIKDNTGGSYSSYIVAYDSAGNYYDSFLMAFHKVGNTYDCIAQTDQWTINASIAQNGTMLGGTFIDQQGKSHDLIPLMAASGLEGSSQTSNPLVSLLSGQPSYAGTWSSCFLQCLSNSGIPSYVVTLIGAACGVGCAVTAGSGCIACALVVVAGYGGIGLGCAQHCWGWF